MSLRLLTLVIVLVAGMLFGLSNACLGEDSLFDRVAPILQRRCLSCHNERERRGGFSLHNAAAALADGHILAGDSAASRLIEVITPFGGDAEMPKNSDPLSPAEIAVIGQWIDGGAGWPDGLVLEAPGVASFDWWSYQTMELPVVPELDNDWVRTPIDAFILDQLQRRGLRYSAPADRRSLIRRLSYDLIGLPPSPEEVASFVQDDDPLAYEKLVDRLLDSKSYGERWARHWLDVVQYADTCGYDKDKLRPAAWPYRDYVIRSLNQDKPYGRFVQEQVAGDVLFPGQPDGILGLGFIAAGPWDFIGHVEVPESKLDGQVARNLDRDDMVSNTLNTFCSLTVQCARCHNHKFDPISQQDYYGLQAIFAAVDRAERPYDLDPQVQQRRRELETELTTLQASRDQHDVDLRQAGGPRLAHLNEQIRLWQDEQKIEKQPQFGYHSVISQSQQVEKWIEIDLGGERNASSIVIRPCHDEFAGIGAGFGFPVRYKVEAAAEDGIWVLLHDQTQHDQANPGLSPQQIDLPQRKLRRVRLTATKLAPRSSDFILAMAEIQVLDGGGNNLALAATVNPLDSIEAPPRWSAKNLVDGHWPRSTDPKLAEDLAAAIAERAEILAALETAERLAQRRSLDESITEARQELAALPAGKMVYAAATHFKPQGNFHPTEGKPRPVSILHRGEVGQPGELAVPTVLPLSNQSDGRLDPQLSEAERRAELARWLTTPDHPLVWRSIVNRVWQYHFGQGIVATPNDFGRMGAEPTHPQLLDWLAVSFRDGGQSLKQLHRMMVTSSVYQQSSDSNDANAAIDGGNQYLWRMNRRRLEAEEIRDSILAVSGALDPRRGGPGFYLFELEKAEHSPHFEYHKFDPSNPASHRRSIYRFVVRSQPNPWMTTLDCADSSQSTPKRNETVTALQALSLLNNRFNLVMAERMAERLTTATSDLSDQVELAMALVVQRPIQASERDELVAYARDHGLANLCRILFNLSEFVYVD